MAIKNTCYSLRTLYAGGGMRTQEKQSVLQICTGTETEISKEWLQEPIYKTNCQELEASIAPIYPP